MELLKKFAAEPDLTGAGGAAVEKNVAVVGPSVKGGLAKETH